MKKTYCDRCNNESKTVIEERLIMQISNTGAPILKSVELCPMCKRKLDFLKETVIQQITKTQVAVYQAFMCDMEVTT